jgi:hypothetical protein
MLKGSFADFHNLKYLAQPRDFNISMNSFQFQILGSIRGLRSDVVHLG